MQNFARLSVIWFLFNCTLNANSPEFFIYDSYTSTPKKIFVYGETYRNLPDALKGIPNEDQFFVQVSVNTSYNETQQVLGLKEEAIVLALPKAGLDFQLTDQSFSHVRFNYSGTFRHYNLLNLQDTVHTYFFLQNFYSSYKSAGGKRIPDVSFQYVLRNDPWKKPGNDYQDAH